MKLVKVLYNKVIEGKEKVMPSYFIECENGKRVMIKPVFPRDYDVLNWLSVFGGFGNDKTTEKDN